MIQSAPSPFNGLCAVGFLARASYALARTPVLPLFALYLGAGPEVIGWVVGISTVTGIFFKLPAGALSDWIGRGRTLFLGLLIFALTPFAYLLVWGTAALLVVRFVHGFATAIYGPVAMAVVAGAGAAQGRDALLVLFPHHLSAPCWAPRWAATSCVRPGRGSNWATGISSESFY